VCGVGELKDPRGASISANRLLMSAFLRSPKRNNCRAAEPDRAPPIGPRPRRRRSAESAPPRCGNRRCRRRLALRVQNTSRTRADLSKAEHSHLHSHLHSHSEHSLERTHTRGSLTRRAHTSQSRPLRAQAFTARPFTARRGEPRRRLRRRRRRRRPSTKRQLVSERPSRRG
jgi:hypothetical protein